MNETGDRLRKLRESLCISQAKFGKIAGMAQATVNRYETGYSAVPLKTLMWYADYFDVSMDYLCGRTERPEGKLYAFKPKTLSENSEMRQFIEMCFDPKSLANEKLKDILVQMLEEVKK